MKSTQKLIIILALALSYSNFSYSKNLDEDTIYLSQNSPLDEEAQKAVFLLMIKNGMILNTLEGLTVTEKGESIFESLLEEGRVEEFDTRVATICLSHSSK